MVPLGKIHFGKILYINDLQRLPSPSPTIAPMADYIAFPLSAPIKHLESHLKIFANSLTCQNNNDINSPVIVISANLYAGIRINFCLLCRIIHPVLPIVRNFCPINITIYVTSPHIPIVRIFGLRTLIFR